MSRALAATEIASPSGLTPTRISGVYTPRTPVPPSAQVLAYLECVGAFVRAHRAGAQPSYLAGLYDACELVRPSGVVADA